MCNSCGRQRSLATVMRKIFPSVSTGFEDARLADLVSRVGKAAAGDFLPIFQAAEFSRSGHPCDTRELPFHGEQGKIEEIRSFPLFSSFSAMAVYIPCSRISQTSFFTPPGRSVTHTLNPIFGSRRHWASCSASRCWSGACPRQPHSRWRRARRPSFATWTRNTARRIGRSTAGNGVAGGGPAGDGVSAGVSCALRVARRHLRR